MAVEEAIVQGVTSGGISGLTLWLLMKYILPKLDEIDNSINALNVKISENIAKNK